MKVTLLRTFVVVGLAFAHVVPAVAQQAVARDRATSTRGSAESGDALPPGYVIGVDDVLSVVFWRDKEMSADVVVRPDGKISLPLVNDVQAAGYTPEQLRGELVKAASRFIEDPNATVVVKEIHSRRVFVTGQVAKPGTYDLTGDMNVLQLIAEVGGLLEYADEKNIVVIRNTGGKEQRFRFNYKDVVRGKNVNQNILLQPGDTVVVP